MSTGTSTGTTTGPRRAPAAHRAAGPGGVVRPAAPRAAPRHGGRAPGHRPARPGQRVGQAPVPAFDRLDAARRRRADGRLRLARRLGQQRQLVGPVPGRAGDLQPGRHHAGRLLPRAARRQRPGRPARHRGVRDRDGARHVRRGARAGCPSCGPRRSCSPASPSRSCCSPASSPSWAVSSCSASTAPPSAADGAVRGIVGVAGYLATVGVLGVALGFIVSSTAGGVATMCGLLLVAPTLGLLLPSSWQEHTLPYLPSNAGAAFFSARPSADSLTAGAGADRPRGVARRRAGRGRAHADPPRRLTAIRDVHRGAGSGLAAPACRNIGTHDARVPDLSRLPDPRSARSADLPVRLHRVRRAPGGRAVLQRRRPHRVPGLRRPPAQGLLGRRRRLQGLRLLQDRLALRAPRARGRQGRRPTRAAPTRPRRQGPPTRAPATRAPATRAPATRAPPRRPPPRRRRAAPRPAAKSA